LIVSSLRIRYELNRSVRLPHLNKLGIKNTKIFLIAVIAISFLIPAAAITNVNAVSTSIITSSSSSGATKVTTFKCKDPTSQNLLCVLVITTVKPPTHTLTCSDLDNHRYPCTYIVVNRKDTNTKVFHKIVFLYVYVTPSQKKTLLQSKKIVIINVTKTVVKVIHEHESSGSVRIVVLKEEDDNDRPTVQVIDCFQCVEQQINVANSRGVLINSPITITSVIQINNIITNVNNINSQSTINNNEINNEALSNTNIVNSATVDNPPPPPEYSPSVPAVIPATTRPGTTTIGAASSIPSSGIPTSHLITPPHSGPAPANINQGATPQMEQSNPGPSRSTEQQQQPLMTPPSQSTLPSSPSGNTGSSGSNSNNNGNNGQQHSSGLDCTSNLANPACAPPPPTSNNQQCPDGSQPGSNGNCPNPGSNNAPSQNRAENNHGSSSSSSNSNDQPQACPEGSQPDSDGKCTTQSSKNNQPQIQTQTCPDGSVIAASDTCPIPPSNSNPNPKPNDNSPAVNAHQQQQFQNQPDCNANPADPACAPPPPTDNSIPSSNTNPDNSNNDHHRHLSQQQSTSQNCPDLNGNCQSQSQTQNNQEQQQSQVQTCPDGSVISASDTCPTPSTNSSPNYNSNPTQQSQTPTKICPDRLIVDIHEKCLPNSETGNNNNDNPLTSNNGYSSNNLAPPVK